jgi:putative hydrolase of the HAD superfamily
MLRPQAYRYIFFDLDHTLWDFDTNARETLRELYQVYALEKHGLQAADEFVDGFFAVNDQLWDAHSQGQLDKERLRTERFGRVFTYLGLDLSCLPAELGSEYIQRCCRKAGLLPYALEVLKALHGRYRLCILTNGFSDSQQHKLEAAAIHTYFDAVYTADEIGYQKPDPAYFQAVMQRLNTRPEECLMIGDNLKTDILGAQAAGLDHIYYNPNRRRYTLYVQHDISCLSELLNLL